MNPAVVFVAGLVILPVVGLLIWTWLTRAEAIEELLSFKDGEGSHFEG